MGKLKEWTLFPMSIHVQAEDEEGAIAQAKTALQRLLSSQDFEWEDIVDEGEVEDEAEIDEEEIVKLDKQTNIKEFPDDENY